jgi:hypothetical protein
MRAKLGVVVVEAAGERFDQGGVPEAQPPAGERGEHLGVALAGDQRLEHRPPGDTEDVAGDRGELDQGVLEQLLQPLRVPGALLDQVEAQPRVVAQPADLRGRDEEGPQHPALVQLRQPDDIELVGLRPARHLLDLAGVTEPDGQPAGLEQVDERAPVVRGRLDHHPLDRLPRQLLGERADRVRRRLHAPDLGHAPARDRGVRDARAHLPAALGDVDRGHPLDNLLVLLGLDLHRLSTHQTPPLLVGTQRAARGPRSGKPKF